MPSSSTIGGSELEKQDKDRIMIITLREIYRNSNYRLKDMTRKVKFGITHISFDQDFNISLVHPVLWAPRTPIAPYVQITAPRGRSTTWKDCVAALRSAGLENCAVRIRDASGRSLTVPPQKVLYAGVLQCSTSRKLRKAIIRERLAEMEVLRGAFRSGTTRQQTGALSQSYLDYTSAALEEALDELDEVKHVLR